MRDLGAIMAPMNAFLTVLGMDTLHLRMPRHSDNALAVAKVLESSDQVEWVKYAGLESDPDHQRALKYFDNCYCAISRRPLMIIPSSQNLLMIM